MCWCISSFEIYSKTIRIKFILFLSIPPIKTLLSFHWFHLFETITKRYLIKLDNNNVYMWLPPWKKMAHFQYFKFQVAVNCFGLETVGILLTLIHGSSVGYKLGIFVFSFWRGCLSLILGCVPGRRTNFFNVYYLLMELLSDSKTSWIC